MKNETVMLSLKVPKDLKTKLKVESAKRNLNMQKLLIQALEKELGK